MGPVLTFVAHYWWLIFPVSAIAGPWLHRYNRQVEKRRQYKLEMARAKSAAQIEERRLTRVNAEQLRTALRTHDDVDERWWNYEIDLATIISYPMLVDVREPLTREFHKAKGRADMLRPPPGVEVDDPVAFVEYRDAVVEYAAAFDAAEREARRRKQADFSPIEREALERARRLVMIAADEAATPAERQAAYRKARKELDGLIEIPVVGAQQLEHSIAKELEG
ncbi:hypothetical protein GOARA_068_01060 [Gordonia araii NBRC 100433]|uniref:Uncharacterized protein n=1 Tax=Gordonia araii NBRC 100433 TaxID=1073574 RepID=G7H6H0_9ACTN|nr:hypothetical protein [Gordonia araii]NNG96125.1 hypothetical protein [Gordonia araii NBRC 100433]GAB11445.1 hypothetical protein GOARA_068_01060 [Gordonia araii NBRC 100433]